MTEKTPDERPQQRACAPRRPHTLRELGQGSVEYIGIAVVSALVIAGILTVPIGDTMSAGLGRTICQIFKQSSSAQGAIPAQAAAITGPQGRITIAVEAGSCPLAAGTGDSTHDSAQDHSGAQNQNGSSPNNANSKNSALPQADAQADRQADAEQQSSGQTQGTDADTSSDANAGSRDGSSLPGVSPQGYDGPFTKGDDGFIYDGNGSKVPYSNPKKRPSYGEGQVEAVWDRSRAEQLEDIANGDLEVDESGFVPEKLKDNEIYVLDTDGNWRSVIWKPGDSRSGKWDMGHLPGHEFRDLHKCYLSGEISQEQFLRNYRSPDNYKVEDPGRNQSHVDENSDGFQGCGMYR